MGTDKSIQQEGYFLPIFAVIIVILVITGGYFLYQKQSTKSAVIPQQASQPVPPPTQIPDETATWQTITQGKLFFKIPPNWINKGILINPVPLTNATDTIAAFEIITKPNSNVSQEKDAKIKSSSITIIKEKEISVSGFSGISLTGKVGIGPLEGTTITIALVQVGNDVYGLENLDSRYASYSNQILSTFKFNDQPQNISATSPSRTINAFTKLDGQINQENLSTFSDSTLGITLKYPQSYFVNTLKADTKHLSADLYFLKEKDSKREGYIQDEIDCTLSNRKDPSGVCSEGTISDADVNISLVKSIPAFEEDKIQSWNECLKEVLDEKIVYSCSSIISAANQIGDVYRIYLSTDNKIYLLSIRSPKAKDIPDLITTLVKSFTAN